MLERVVVLLALIFVAHGAINTTAVTVEIPLPDNLALYECNTMSLLEDESVVAIACDGDPFTMVYAVDPETMEVVDDLNMMECDVSSFAGEVLMCLSGNNTLFYRLGMNGNELEVVASGNGTDVYNFFNDSNMVFAVSLGGTPEKLLLIGSPTANTTTGPFFFAFTLDVTTLALTLIGNISVGDGGSAIYGGVIGAGNTWFAVGSTGGIQIFSYPALALLQTVSPSLAVYPVITSAKAQTGLLLGFNFTSQVGGIEVYSAKFGTNNFAIGQSVILPTSMPDDVPVINNRFFGASGENMLCVYLSSDPFLLSEVQVPSSTLGAPQVTQQIFASGGDAMVSTTNYLFMTRLVFDRKWHLMRHEYTCP